MTERPAGRPPRRGRAATDPRIAAFDILREVDRGAYADRAAEARLGPLGARDRALARELSFGVLRLRARLDAELSRLLRRPPGEVEPAVVDWLRVGLYQLRELRVPDHAAVNETVEGARRTLGPRPVSLVNAVLRAAARQGPPPDLFPRLEHDPVGHLSTYGSHPEWLVRRWLDRWPLADVVRLVENDNRPPPVTFRLLGDGLAAAQPDAEDAAARAGARGEGREGIEVRPLEAWPGVYHLAAGDPGELLERVPAVVQDPAASAVVEYAAAGARGPLFDACAAPGGKAVALAFAVPGARPLVAGDVSPERLRRLREARSRTGAEVWLVAADARRPPLRGAATVLIDAPCTGTGALRRRPDARWRVDAERLASLVRLQGELLEGCAPLVEPGGLLVYATCSLEAEENELQVESFLARRPEFRRDGRVRFERIPPPALGPEGDLRVLPWLLASDGAYACRLRRREAA